MNYKNKVVLVTGSSKGLGKCIVEEYAKLGANVIINYNKSEYEAKLLEKQIKEKYQVKTLCIKCDISNEEEVKNMIKEIINTFNHIDILVNNAGISIDSDIIDKNSITWNKILNTNLIGTFLVSKYASIHMNNGSIINISSNNPIYDYNPYSMDYDASKAGVISLTKNLAVEYSGRIRVNCICPGWINTDMSSSINEEYQKEEESKIILNRFAEPIEIANVVLFLSSDKASYINGSIIVVDGGRK